MKLAAIELGFRAGAFRLAQLALRRDRALILTFHRFSSSAEPLTGRLPVERLDEYMRYLTEHYRVVPLRSLVAQLRRGAVVPYTAAVTVDDGYHDMFSVAAPVMRRYGVPASVFVVSDFLDGRLWLWTDQFRYLFARAPRAELTVRHRGQMRPIDMRDDADRARHVESWRAYAKRLPVTERDELLAELAEACNVAIPAAPPPEYRPMSWGELRVLASDGFDVGAHTRTHPILSRISRQQLRDEIEGSREQIEARIGSRVCHFAYPNGMPEYYTPEVVTEIARSGYRAAVTAITGGNTPATPLLELRRVDAGAPDLAHFAQSSSGFEEVKLGLRAGRHSGRQSVTAPADPVVPAGGGR